MKITYYTVFKKKGKSNHGAVNKTIIIISYYVMQLRAILCEKSGAKLIVLVGLMVGQQAIR